MAEEPRKCKQCGKPLVRKRWNKRWLETPKMFARREFCDNECKFEFFRKKRTEPEFCKECGKELVRKEYEDGRQEPWAAFLRRTFCDRFCAGKYGGKMEKKKKQDKRRTQTATTQTAAIQAGAWWDGADEHNALFNPFG